MEDHVGNEANDRIKVHIRRLLFKHSAYHTVNLVESKMPYLLELPALKARLSSSST